MKSLLLIALTMIAFAANSIFCRLALLDGGNDPLSFTLVRLGAGAVALSYFLFRFRREETFKLSKNILLAPLMLF